MEQTRLGRFRPFGLFSGALFFLAKGILANSPHPVPLLFAEKDTVEARRQKLHPSPTKELVGYVLLAL